jgi:hypothetical protein
MEFEPTFDFDSLGSSVLLSQGSVEISTEKNKYQGIGEARLDFFPSPRISFGGVFQGFVESKDIIFSFNNRPVEGFPASNEFESNSGETNITWVPKSEPFNAVGEKFAKIKRVVFHLFNFVNFFGSRGSTLQDEDGTRSIEHIDLISDDWNIEIKSLSSTRNNF